MTTRATNQPEVSAAAYAVSGDFCRIFAEQMNGLFQLSLCLTADPALAERCFVSGLEDSLASNRVFKDWAHSWARRTVIQNAIRLLKPSRRTETFLAPSSGGAASDSDALFSALLGLPTFERFVFVMSVLERHSDQDCKTLLGCSRQDIVKARAQALKRLAVSAEKPAAGAAVGGGSLRLRPRLIAETA
jgi:hypothetical protein